MFTIKPVKIDSKDPKFPGYKGINILVSGTHDEYNNGISISNDIVSETELNEQFERINKELRKAYKEALEMLKKDK